MIMDLMHSTAEARTAGCEAHVAAEKMDERNRGGTTVGRRGRGAWAWAAGGLGATPAPGSPGDVSHAARSLSTASCSAVSMGRVSTRKSGQLDMKVLGLKAASTERSLRACVHNLVSVARACVRAPELRRPLANLSRTAVVEPASEPRLVTGGKMRSNMV